MKLFTDMKKYRYKFRPGFTMIELALAATAMVIMILGVGMIIADSHNSWNKMYIRTNGEVASGAYIAKKTFDSIVRRANIGSLSIDNDGAWVDVSYSSNPRSKDADSHFLLCRQDLLALRRWQPSTNQLCQTVPGDQHHRVVG